ncbi:MAG: hypothetical protein U1F49_19145 [Rubrivivax sp.]
MHQFWKTTAPLYGDTLYYEGPTLRAVLSALGRPPTEAEVRRWLEPLMNALAALHAERWHRDIALDNVLITANGPLLLDFGAARQVIGDVTHTLTAVLKPGYAPIEQYGEMPNLAQGPWTDIYALASVLYGAIGGVKPAPSVERLMDDRLRPLAQLAGAAGRGSWPRSTARWRSGPRSAAVDRRVPRAARCRWAVAAVAARARAGAAAPVPATAVVPAAAARARDVDIGLDDWRPAPVAPAMPPASARPAPSAASTAAAAATANATAATIAATAATTADPATAASTAAATARGAAAVAAARAAARAARCAVVPAERLQLPVAAARRRNHLRRRRRHRRAASLSSAWPVPQRLPLAGAWRLFGPHDVRCRRRRSAGTRRRRCRRGLCRFTIAARGRLTPGGAACSFFHHAGRGGRPSTRPAGPLHGHSRESLAADDQPRRSRVPVPRVSLVHQHVTIGT